LGEWVSLKMLEHCFVSW